ncbi:EamA family transporter RarD [Moraxella sp. VT-16-12]|uniref:EamA family transporter RarD n=1 Tax=Moraxella sp. VT-16-12 TaxID=2014877 RepID=UPI000B7F067F|nr:EamA family transporter RarD [Moraxella sp. VT-16-12]TWV81342.1 EamA family transporter RarD [Moraxella sp. VT-16-12]
MTNIYQNTTQAPQTLGQSDTSSTSHATITPKIHPTKNTLTTGIVLALLSNVLFGVLYAYGKWLTPLSGTDVFLWRMVMMWACLGLFLLISGKFGVVIADLKAVKGLKSWFWLLLPTPIFASQLWLFMWAPINGHGVAVSMGYFLFPLVMVMVGALMGERLARLQWIAVGLAGLGVAFEIVRTGQVSLATFWVCLTYPIYYVIRRKQGVRALTGLWLDVSLIAPVCLLVLINNDAAWGQVLGSGALFAKAVGLGVISVLALQFNLEANRLLPTSLFGMLGYFEPALLFLLSVTVLGGVFSVGMLLSFGLIWAGIACLVGWGLMKNNKC